MQLGIPPEVERIFLSNLEAKFAEGWLWLGNIPLEAVGPWYPVEIIASDPCYAAIELAKDEFGTYNVTVGPPLREGKPPGRVVRDLRQYGKYGLYVYPNMGEISDIIKEWLEIPYVRSKILDARLDRWLENNA